MGSFHVAMYTSWKLGLHLERDLCQKSGFKIYINVSGSKFMGKAEIFESTGTCLRTIALIQILK